MIRDDITQEIKDQLEEAQKKRDTQRLGDLHRASLSRQNNFNQSDLVYDSIAEFQELKYHEANLKLVSYFFIDVLGYC